MLHFPHDFLKKFNFSTLLSVPSEIIVMGILDQVKNMGRQEMTQYFEGDKNFCSLIYTN